MSGMEGRVAEGNTGSDCTNQQSSLSMGVDSITELYQGIPVEGPEFSDAAACVVLWVGDVQPAISWESRQVEAASGNTEDHRMCGVVQHSGTIQK